MDGGGTFPVFELHRFGTRKPAGAQNGAKPLPSGTEIEVKSQRMDVKGWNAGGSKTRLPAHGRAAIPRPGPVKKLQIVVARAFQLANIRAPFPLFGIRGIKTARQ